MKKTWNDFKNYCKNNPRYIILGLILGMATSTLLFGGCVFKKDFVRYQNQQVRTMQDKQDKQDKASKDQTTRIQWLERRLREHKKMQRLQSKKRRN